MKLLHITATHLNLAGGIPVVLRDLVEAQNKINDFEARVLCVNSKEIEIKSRFFDVLNGKNFKEYIDNYSPDAVIFHSHYYFCYIKLYKYLNKKNIPYFIEPHGSFGKAALNKSKYKKFVANKILLHSFMSHANAYIFLNQAEKDDAQFFTSNDLIIPNGINLSEINASVKYRDEFELYYIGRFDIIHKGLDYLFDALDILESKGIRINLSIYGKGSEDEIEYVNSRISAYHTLNVRNKGPIYGHEQIEKFEQCGVMILTSRYEGFPMTVLEAWKYGNPCIVTPGTNVFKEVKSNALGWSVELDSSKIAETITMALNEYEENRESYIRRCKEYVSGNYSWDNIAELSYKKLKEYLK